MRLGFRCVSFVPGMRTGSFAELRWFSSLGTRRAPSTQHGPHSGTQTPGSPASTQHGPHSGTQSPGSPASTQHGPHSPASTQHGPHSPASTQHGPHSPASTQHGPHSPASTQHGPQSPGSPAPTPEEKQPRARRSPAGCSVLLFPGQGSQFVGMCRGLLKYSNVKDMFCVAQKILGYDLLSLCLHGPEEELRQTVHCQPAVFVTSLAAVERLNHENPQAIESCVAAAGFSVGEFAALVFSGAMDFAEALYAVKVRAEAMQRASELVPSAMLSVIGRPQAKYNYACLQAREHCLSLGLQEPVCSVANYLFPDGRVIAGHRQAIDFLQQDPRRHHFLRARALPVSGAFHTELMASAVEPLRDVLRQVEVRRPEISVYSNVDGKRYMHGDHVRKQLVKQLVSPVKWEQTLHEVYERTQGHSFPHTYETGPGKQLGATLQKCNSKAYKNYTNVEVTSHED